MTCVDIFLTLWEPLFAWVIINRAPDVEYVQCAFPVIIVLELNYASALSYQTQNFIRGKIAQRNSQSGSNLLAAVSRFVNFVHHPM